MAQKPDSLVKKNSFILGLYGGFSRPYLDLDLNANVKDKSIKNPLFGLGLSFERNLKKSHYLVFSLSYFYGQNGIMTSFDFVNQNNESKNMTKFLKREYSFSNIECNYRKRWQISKKNNINLLVDVGLYYVFYVDNINSYKDITTGQGLTTELSYKRGGSSLKNSNNNNKIFNTSVNFSIINRIGVETKLKKYKISILLSNYLNGDHTLNHSPKRFNPLLTIQLHV